MRPYLSIHPFLKKLFLLIGCFISLFSARANTFIVTSNADSGPGTLREAIGFANNNGAILIDSIIFNISSTTEAGRTIALQFELPALTSNIIIDGTTQPAPALGISGAKITLFLDHFTPVPFNFLFINNASNIKIFGLCFRFFDNPDAGGGGNYAIVLRNSKDITIGGAGKGNLFTLVRIGITNNYWNYYSDSVRNVIIQGNVFGLNSQNNPAHRGSIELIRATNITIGGTTPEEGNVFVGVGVSVSQVGAVSSDFFLKFQNNKLGLDWTGSRYYLYEGGSLIVYGSETDNTSATKTFILNNVFSGSWLGGIGLSGLYHKVFVKGNKLGTDINGMGCINSYYNALNVYNCKYVEVGGYTPEEENIIPEAVYTQRRGTHFIKNQFGTIGIAEAIKPGDPFINIIGYDNGLITGKSNPNAKIQLYTNTCDLACIRRKYLTTVYSDANGNWSFPYTSGQPNIEATATTADSSTSEFTGPKVTHNNIKIAHATCGKSNGSVKGFIISEGTHIRWINTSTGQTVSTDTNLVNMPAGRYELRVSNGENGCVYGGGLAYTIENFVPPSSISASITDASCGKSNGAIYTMADYYHLSIKWINAAGDSIGQYDDKFNLAPGTYYVKGWIPEDSSCNKMYGPFVVKNVSGPSLNTDDIQITAAVCDNTNGSIKGITALNAGSNLFLQWVDSLNQPVGNGYDLSNVRSGKYRLKFKDASGCDTIITSFYRVPNNGIITIDRIKQQITPAKCNGFGGSITDMNVGGADSFEWKNTITGNVAGNTLNISNLSPGNYQLTATNKYGCTKTTPPITVRQAEFTPIVLQGVSSGEPRCGPYSGFASAFFSDDTSGYSFRWIDSASSQVVGVNTRAVNLPQGTYILFAKDSNGCEQQIVKVVLKELPPPSLDVAQLKVGNDRCATGIGSISGITVKDIIAGRFVWLNERNDSIGNSITIYNLQQGRYRLKVIDGGCIVYSEPITVGNDNIVLPGARYDEIIILKNTAAELKIKNYQVGRYWLIDDLSLPPLTENTTGNFTTPLLHGNKVYYVRYKHGTCESELVAVRITVIDKTAIYVPTAFTPNGDGKNDILKVFPSGRIKLLNFSVYNRWGQVVFTTNTFSKGWDGVIKGQPLHTTTFVWIVTAVDEISGKTFGQQGTVTVVR